MSKRNHTRAYVVGDPEHLWVGFMYDKDSNSDTVRRLFRNGIPTAKKHDEETVIEARDARRTVLTANGPDFLRFMADAQKVDNFDQCTYCWGLLWLPNPDFDKVNALKKLDIQHGVTVNGKCLPWKSLGYLNLCVRVHRDGTYRVTRFKRRCHFCEEETPIQEDWYLTLPTAL
jgi:hypothetical protein